MIKRDRGANPSRFAGAVRSPAVRAGVVVAALWIGSAILLRATSDFGAIIAIATCASVAVWDSGGSRGRLPRLVLWIALLAAVCVALWDSPRLPGMLVLFGAAALWFVAVEPLLQTRAQG